MTTTFNVGDIVRRTGSTAGAVQKNHMYRVTRADMAYVELEGIDGSWNPDLFVKANVYVDNGKQKTIDREDEWKDVDASSLIRTSAQWALAAVGLEVRVQVRTKRS